MALPEEVIHGEILVRLPIRSLVRFRSVSKSWNSLFFDPEFTQFHFTLRSSNPNYDDDDEYLIVKTHYQFALVDDPYDYISIISRNNLSETRINKVPSHSGDVDLVGSINGIVCLASLYYSNNYFILWNPIIHQFKKILAPKDFVTTPLIGFGWDAMPNDFKLIWKRPNSVQCVVYSSKTDSWRQTPVSRDVCNMCGIPCTIVKGCPYWSCAMEWIIKFQVESNEFRSFQVSNYYRGLSYRLINLNDCLARVEEGGPFLSHVYRFDEECMVWSKMYTLEVNYYRPSMCFKYGGEIVFYEKECLYDHKSKEIKSIAYDEEGLFVNGCSYTPSLILIEGMKAVYV